MSNYHAYLIRLWRDDEQQPWRAELVSPHNGQARHFATPEQAYAYLQQQLRLAGDESPKLFVVGTLVPSEGDESPTTN